MEKKMMRGNTSNAFGWCKLGHVKFLSVTPPRRFSNPFCNNPAPSRKYSPAINFIPFPLRPCLIVPFFSLSQFIPNFHPSTFHFLPLSFPLWSLSFSFPPSISQFIPTFIPLQFPLSCFPLTPETFCGAKQRISTFSPNICTNCIPLQV